MDKITVGVLTVSDRCESGEAVDESGPNLVGMIARGAIGNGAVTREAVVRDSAEAIEKVLKAWSDDGIDVILTTGGTGVAKRDVTPEATEAVIERTIPGISMLMFERSRRATSLAALSRGVAGVRGKTLIINLPGSKKAAGECLGAVAEVIPHAVDLINGRLEQVKLVHDSLGGKTKKSSVIADTPAFRQRESPYACISVKEAQDIIMDRICLLRREKVVWYGEARDHVLTQDVIATGDLPPFDASLKDGYAVRSKDTSCKRSVAATSHAGGSRLDVALSPGECARVSTGAAIPPGADAVVEVEQTSVSETTENGKEEKVVALRNLPRKGQDVRKKGSDFKAGNVLMSTGTRLDPAAVGLLAAAGVTSVRVWEKPLVAVISTGDELANPEETLRWGKVRDSNRVTLLNLLREENFEAVDGGIAPDDPDALRAALENGFRAADVVVTSGGVSMGERDYLKEVLVSDFGAEIYFGRVYMKPGKPTSFAIVTFEGKPKAWFGLPGNPASAFVTAHLFLLPGLRRITGLQKVFPMSVLATLKGEVVEEDRPQYVRAVLTHQTDGWLAEVTGNQRSSRIGSCVNANCFVEIESGIFKQINRMFHARITHVPYSYGGTSSSGFCSSTTTGRSVSGTTPNNAGSAPAETASCPPAPTVKAFLIGKYFT